MATPKVSLYVRVTLPDGTHPYLTPVYGGNRKLREGWAIGDGEPQRFDGAVYYLRFARSGKRVWERVGTSAALASVALQRTETRLKAASEGIALAPAGSSGDVAATSRSLLDCVREYIAETTAHKSKKTLAAYSETLFLFIEALDAKHRRKPVAVTDPETGEERSPELADYMTDPRLLSDPVRSKSMKDISRADLLTYKSFLERRGNAPRTVRNRVDFLQIFLHHFGLPSLLKGKDLPRYTDKKVRAYNAYELGRMIAYATADEADFLYFLLCTGTREQEAQYACWSDLDLVTKTYTVTEHRDLGFTPKDKEEGEIQLSDVLVARLIARRMRFPKTRLIFEGASGNSNGHALRVLKSLALRSGINCGHCVSKAGLSCAEHPVCRHAILHKFRKSYASMLHQAGVSARTIMGFLRHSNLETTLRYLAEGSDEKTREKINATFVDLGGAR